MVKVEAVGLLFRCQISIEVVLSNVKETVHRSLLQV